MPSEAIAAILAPVGTEPVKATLRTWKRKRRRRRKRRRNRKKEKEGEEGEGDKRECRQGEREGEG